MPAEARAKACSPEIGTLQAIEGFGADGTPTLCAPRRDVTTFDVTTRMLMLHTAAFGYDVFNETCNRFAQHHGQPSVVTAAKAPLLFDPGEASQYGSNIDRAPGSSRGSRAGASGTCARSASSLRSA